METLNNTWGLSYSAALAQAYKSKLACLLEQLTLLESAGLVCEPAVPPRRSCHEQPFSSYSQARCNSCKRSSCLGWFSDAQTTGWGWPTGPEPGRGGLEVCYFWWYSWCLCQNMHSTASSAHNSVPGKASRCQNTHEACDVRGKAVQ